ncbi:Hypothetical protein ABZS17D1_01547 [Kosakonia cowanii]
MAACIVLSLCFNLVQNMPLQKIEKINRRSTRRLFFCKQNVIQ